MCLNHTALQRILSWADRDDEADQQQRCVVTF